MPRLSKIGAAALAAFGWSGQSTVTASYLVVAGGGSGGAESIRGAGGGGAGGLLAGTTSLNPTLSYTVTIGAGGASVSSASLNTGGNSGSNSQFGTLTAAVGGGGGGIGPSGTAPTNAKNGGSGGGSGADGSGTSTAGTGTSSQGSNGGSGFSSASTAAAGGGGGGSSAVGGNASSSTGGSGGAGTASSISGASVTYAGGGGGGSSGGGTAGSGGGGTGGTTGGSGTANTGSGGGGIQGSSSGSGGSGVVIISYLGAQQFGGGIVTSVGGYTIHTFNTSGTLAPISSLTASYLIVAGGGGGGGGGTGNVGGAGGAGGLLTGSGLTIDTNSTYVVTVGAGGSASLTASTYGYTGAGTNGGNSIFSAYATVAVGGGYGASDTTAASSGGSGGGSGYGGNQGSGTSGQGNNGGYVGGGSGSGGGAGAAGGSLNGGIGVSSSISGTATYYAGGGGAGTSSSPSGAGGLGGGGTGAIYSPATAATSATASTGGGGGAGRYLQGVGGFTTTTNGGLGGSGIVIISYAGSVQQMAGGTVTISGGNVIHTFTSSGYLTPLKYVGNSLRFRSSASAYLNRTPASAGNSTSFTYSLWVKRGILSAYEPLYHSGTSNANGSFVFGSNDTFSCQLFNSPSANYGWSSTMVFRDPAAWYHIVIRGFASSSSNSYGGVELALYVNGVQQTFTGAAFNTPTTTNRLTDATAKQIGGDTVNTAYFDGEITEFNYIDGQALTPNSFGTFNSYGVWQPITYGGSYGTNGFYLPFNAGTTSYVGGFNGSSQYLYLGGQSNFAFGSNNFTIEFWVNANTYAGTPLLYDGRGSGTTGGAYPTIYIDSAAGSIVYYTNGGVQITSPTTIAVNTWNHIAVVRSGTTTTLYLNGISQGTYSDSQSYLNGASRPLIANNGYNVSNYLNGYMSNLRVVNGTAVYTSNFIPSTTPLTAITNTQLLTLQNATIVDNSTNAFTINNVGSVTTNLNYPFSASKIFKDQGPAGNNWTPNNISGASGSTLDYMTDVPTLTSTTAANYCTLNPLSKGSSVTLSNGNLTYYSPSSTAPIAQGTIGVTSGKWYFEATVTDSNPNFVAGFWSASDGTNYPTYYWDYGGNTSSPSTAIEKSSGTISSQNTAIAVQNDVIGVALDYNNATISFYRNNSLVGTVSSMTINGATLFPTASVWTGGRSATNNYNFGQQPFQFSPPSGYVALNTYNL